MIRQLRANKLWNDVQKRAAVYSRALTHAERLSEQLACFNRCWHTIRLNVPYYKSLSSSVKLPESFQSWEEVMEKLPVIDRPLVQKHHKELSDGGRQPEWLRTTGGSTAQPVQLPAWKLEDDYTSPDIWLGRSWYGIRPIDRLFMIWGHAHLLGTGWRGPCNRYKREIKDRLLGYYRFSAYNMNDVSMKAAADALLRFRPDYMIGYSFALDAFARSNLDKKKSLRAIELKAVIGAAEAFPALDSVELIERILGAPVAMEYGSVETNLMAHSHPEGGYRVFWKTYFVEAQESGTSGGRKIRVTSLYPRCFPLIRYDIGDEIELPSDEPDLGVTRISRIMGRCNDYLVLRDGSQIHSELITHSVRSYSEVAGYQAIQKGEDIKLLIVSRADFPSNLTRDILDCLGKIHPELGNIEVQQVKGLRQNIAGKTPIVIRETRSVPLNTECPDL